MVEGMSTHSRELDQTPTWAVATVCAVIILISILMEMLLHHVGEWFTNRRKLALYEALEKVKGELMILGFISLLLTFGQNYISKICVPLRVANTMLPCPYAGDVAGEHGVPAAGEHGVPAAGEHGVPAAGEHGVPSTEDHGGGKAHEPDDKGNAEDHGGGKDHEPGDKNNAEDHGGGKDHEPDDKNNAEDHGGGNDHHGGGKDHEPDDKNNAEDHGGGNDHEPDDKNNAEDHGGGNDHEPDDKNNAEDHGGGKDHEPDDKNNAEDHGGGNDHEPDDKNNAEPATGEHHNRRLLWDDRRFLSAGSESFSCKPGHEPLISLHGLHQLHIFIFFLAVFHVIFSATTMMLGRLKIRGWKDWEKMTSTNDYEFSNDPSRFRLTHETSFVKSHSSSWYKIRFFFYVFCFFRQFFRSVTRADYLTMRNGFVTVHLAPGSKFDFQKYIKRSLEDDFKVVVGISPLLWASVVVFLLLNVNGWESMFWISAMPLIVILAVGTKLQAIITQMAIEIQERHAVVQGIPLVQVSDRHFWFGWPQLVLYLIHLSLFQNAFQITYFLWIWYEFGLHSCFQENSTLLVIRVVMGILVQFMCSYITLPLYALVTQMGSTMKKSIFDEHTSKALKKWHKTAVKKNAEGKPVPTPVRTMGGSPGGSPVHSPSDPLNKFMPSGQPS